MIWLICFVTGAAAHLFWEHILKQRWHAMYHWHILPICEHCSCLTDLDIAESWTQYPYEGGREDSKNPNRSMLLCTRCEMYNSDYWHDMWSEYYQGRL